MNRYIPFLNLASIHQHLEEELVEVFKKTLRSGRFVGGPEVEAFEEGFAAFCSTEYAVGVGSGTDALRFALMAAGVQKNDIVITVPNTFIATTEAISQAGAIPDFVDIDAGSYTIDPAKLNEYIQTACHIDAETGRLRHRQKALPVRAIVPVHLYGQMADMDAVAEIAKRHDLIVIEDACQAHGATYYSRVTAEWQTAGSLGAAAAFSFYPGKNLGACGEAGAITTNSKAIASRARMLRDHGQIRKYFHEIEGYNGRLDAIQAGFLNVKLGYLPQWISHRRQVAAWYNEMLSGIDPIVPPTESDYSRSVYHLYIIRCPWRDRLGTYLKEKGIDVGLHYPIPLHLQKAYSSHHFQQESYPVAENSAREILSLPMFPELSFEDVQTITSAIRNFMTTTPPKINISQDIQTN